MHPFSPCINNRYKIRVISKFMENLSNDSPRFHVVRSSSRKRRTAISEDESSTDRSKRSRSRDKGPSSEFKEDTTSVLEKATENWSESEYEAGDNFDCEPSRPETPIGEAGYEYSSGIPIDWGAEIQKEASACASAQKLESDHEETARIPVGSEHEAFDRRSEYDNFDRRGEAGNNSNPWIAECDHAAAFLKYPIYPANHTLDSHSAQIPDPSEDQPAQPLIRASWAGNFTVFSNQGGSPGPIDGINGCVSDKACAEARLVVERLPPEVRWEKVPKYCLWPKSFQRWGPNDNEIAVFFFPSLARHESAYDSLVMDLIRDDLALKTKVMGSELLLFTSVELPPLFTRFQGKLYLWGVFRGNRPQL